MIKQNDLKYILYKASLDASKPDIDDVWDEVLEQLNEKMPVKKKKRRFILIFFLAFGISAFSGGMYLISRHFTGDSQSLALVKENNGSTERSGLNGSHPENTTKNTIEAHKPAQNENEAPLLIHSNKTSGLSAKNKFPSTPDFNKRVKKEGPPRHWPLASHNLAKTSLDDIFDQDGLQDNDTPSEPTAATTTAVAAPNLELGPGDSSVISDKQASVDSIPKNKKDTVQPGKDDEPEKLKRHFAIGGSLNYTFNNFTTTENRLNGKFGNGLYQVTKQIGMNFYCRIPVTSLYQVQPELGFDPYSTNIQINYRTTGLNIFSRYNLKRIVYSQFGLMNYVEIKKDIYLLGGIYYAHSMPVYGAQLDLVSQGPNSEQILTSSYERKDFRKNVFDLRRNDFGISGGIEYHRNKVSSSLRICRGFMDVTPETPSVYHNFNISFRLGYHFEFGKTLR